MCRVNHTISVLHYGDVQATISCVQSIIENDSNAVHHFFQVLIPSNGNSFENTMLRNWAADYFQSFVEFSADDVAEVVNSASVKPEVCVKELREAQCILICNGDNLGFAAGHNVAIKLALLLETNSVWLLNNDLTIQPGALSAVWKEFSATDGKSIVGATVVDSLDLTAIQCAGGVLFNPYLTTVSPFYAGETVNNVMECQSHRMDYIYGASMFIPAQVFRDVGLLNEDFFLFYEELDFCRRAQKAGYSLEWCRNAVVTHRNNDEKADSELRIYHSVRSFTLFVRRHYPKYWLVMALVHAAGRSFVQIKAKSFLNICIIGKGFLQGCNTALKSNVNFFN